MEIRLTEKSVGNTYLSKGGHQVEILKLCELPEFKDYHFACLVDSWGLFWYDRSGAVKYGDYIQVKIKIDETYNITCFEAIKRHT